MSNSIATTTLTYPSFFNFFRVGLGIYGFGDTNAQLKPALTWKTRIASIKIIPKNSHVSYACTYITKRTTRVALLPVGYVDGYQLRFSNKTFVCINNIAYAPVIGRVGMNMTMIDITDCSASVNNEVTLIGHNAQTLITEIAQATNIYNIREIFTGIHYTIPRIVIE